MLTKPEQLAAVLAAALLLALATASATAGRLSTSNDRFRIVWTSLTFGRGPSGQVQCSVTMEGSFHSATLRKSVGALVGSITRATFPCVELNQSSLPWHLRYRGFIGTLPSISGVRYDAIGVNFVAVIAGTFCRITTTVEEPFAGTANIASGRITEFRADESITFPLNGMWCGTIGVGHFSGVGVMTGLGEATAISVRLI